MTAPGPFADPADIPGFADEWTRAGDRAPFFRGNSADYLGQADAGRIRIARRETPNGGRLLLPFVRSRINHRFTLGERHLGGLGLEGLVLSNPWFAEGHDPGEVAALIADVFRDRDYDALALGELPETSVLRDALDQLPGSLRPLRIGRKESLRWLIDLPATFDGYLDELSKGTRQSARRKMRKLDKEFDVRIEVLTDDDPVAIGRFLEEGERISRMTYQWQIGQRLNNDAATLERYRSLARAGRLRCYLLSLDGVPCAFLRGTVEGRLYHYETPGFDPAHKRHSIGLVILLEAIRDLIETTGVTVFDFGIGGDETGYKSSFGTRNVTCHTWFVLRSTRLRTLMLISGETALSSAKNLADRLIPQGEFRQKLRQRLRPGSG